MRSHRLLPALVGASLAVAAAACASGGAPPRTEPDRTVLTTDQVIRTTVSPAARVAVAAPPAQVFSALAETNLELGVDTKLIDTGNRRIGNIDFFKSRQLGGQRLSQYVSCGETSTGSSIADEYRIHMSLVSTVYAAGDSASEMETAFTAYARDQRGVSSDRIACGTTGRLEDRIRRTVALKLGVSSK